jgi:hypothetical protein
MLIALISCVAIWHKLLSPLCGGSYRLCGACLSSLLCLYIEESAAIGASFFDSLIKYGVVLPTMFYYHLRGLSFRGLLRCGLLPDRSPTAWVPKSEQRCVGRKNQVERGFEGFEACTE